MRDKLIAHLDRAHIANPASLADFLHEGPSDLEGFYKELNLIVNKYDKFARDTYVVWEVDRWDDIDDLLRMMEAGLEAR
jgi:hypothetical protein